MSLSRTVLLVTFCALVSLFYQGRLFAQSSPPTFVKVNPTGTYLVVGPCDQWTPPTSVTLSSLGIAPGDFVRLTRVGAFQWGETFNDDGTTLGAVFRGPSGYISPGPDGQHISFNTGPTACNSTVNDIAEDFNVDPETVVQVPVGATEILFTTNDIYWSDNTDPNGDFGVSLEFGSSWPILVTTTADSGAGSLRDVILAANSDPAPNNITFDPAVFPAATPATIFVGSTTNVDLPNMTGNGDSIDGSGAGVIIDGSQFSSNNGLRVRAKNVTIQNLTIQNFANDAIRIEARNSAPEVSGVIIAGNTLVNNQRGVRADGGNGTTDTHVEVIIIDNTLRDNFRGIAVFGNVAGSDGGNTVDAFIDNNTINAFQTTDLTADRDGIQIIGATADGSGNHVSAIVSNNNLIDIPDDGIIAIGCGGGATAGSSVVDAIITGNVVRYKQDTADPDFNNSGIVVSGAGGETSVSNCSGNLVRFEVTSNTVDGFKNSNIVISGGDGGTTNNELEGIVVGNKAANSPGNPGGANTGGNGILITAGNGTGHMLHDVSVSGNQVSGNRSRGIIISGGRATASSLYRIDVSANAVNGSLPKNANIVPDLAQDGILVTGSDNAVNTNLSEISINGNITKNNQRRGIFVRRGDMSNGVSLNGISDNISRSNLDDGILVGSNVPGSGNTPIAGNQTNDNGTDGLDINSSGYGLSNNSSSRNTAGDGINAVVGNTNDGGNTGRRNGACNQPDFCFNTPLP